MPASEASSAPPSTKTSKEEGNASTGSASLEVNAADRALQDDIKLYVLMAKGERDKHTTRSRDDIISTIREFVARSSIAQCKEHEADLEAWKSAIMNAVEQAIRKA